ncbi:MAG: IPT/TIG domain-containing protein [Blastocatellia bacterium]|nr:IPT/TIG domain-containing protein [Blastocatellia bacterium]
MTVPHMFQTGARRNLFSTVRLVFFLVVAAAVGFGVASNRTVSHGQTVQTGTQQPAAALPLHEYLVPEKRFALSQGVAPSIHPDDQELDALTDAQEAAAKQPKIEKLQPARVAVGGPEFRLRVNGSDFDKDAVVMVNGQPVETIRANKRNLLAQIPASAVASIGKVTVLAKNPDGTTSQPMSFDVIAENGGLVITTLQPTVVLEGLTDFGIKVLGDGFRDKVQVRVGGVKVDQEIRRRGDDGIILATVSTRDVAQAGTVPIQVENDNGISKIFNLTIAQPPPRLEDADPGKLDLNGKDTVVKLRGRNFTKECRVLVNDSVIPSKFVNDQRIDATFPAALLTSTQQLEVVVDIPGKGTSDLIIVTVAGDSPLLFALAPSRVAAGESDFTLQVIGVNLSKEKKKTKVLVDGKSVNFEEVSGRVLTTKIKKEQVDSPGQIKVVVEVDAESTNSASLVVEPADTISTMAGDIPGFKDGVGTKALFTRPSRAALGPDGNLYIADQLNNSVRMYNPSSGEVTTIAGDGIPGYVDSGDVNTTDKNKNNDAVRFNNPLGVAVDKGGTIYVTDFGNDVIRRIQKTGNAFITDTFAGENRNPVNEDTGFKERVGIPGFREGDPKESRFSGPDGIVIAEDGRIYIADAFNNIIRVITPAGVAPTKVASLFGNQFPGIVDGSGPTVRFNTPTGLALNGNMLYVSDFQNHRIRMVNLTVFSASTLTGVAGNGNADGPRFAAKLNGPLGVAVIGNQVFITDNSSSRIRRIEPDGETSTVAGGPDDFADGAGPKARFRSPRGIGTLPGNRLFVLDQGNNRLRQIQN